MPSPLPLAESLQLEAVEVPQAGVFPNKIDRTPKNGWYKLKEKSMTIMDDLGGKSPFFFGNTYGFVDFLRVFGSESLPGRGL